MRYHKVRSERHGALDLGEEEAGNGLAAARAAARRFILEGAAVVELQEIFQMVTAAGGPETWEYDREIFSFQIMSFGAVPVLPEGYAYKGGAARFLMSSLFPGRSVLFPRDYDLLRFGTRWSCDDSRVSRCFMPRDFERGNGVELTADQERYFASRDLSINEVFVMRDRVRCSVLCLLDFLGCVLRPCFYRGGSLHQPAALKGRTLLKMLRLAAETSAAGETWRLIGVPDEVQVDDFDLALELNKVMYRGSDSAERFVALCAKGGILPEGEDLPGLLRELGKGLFGGLDFFDAMPDDLRRRMF